METKICIKCEQEFPLTEDFFPKRKDSKDGFRNECKPCRSEYNKQHRIENIDQHKDRDKRYYDRNKELNNQRSKKYRETHKEEIAKKDKERYDKKRDQILEQKREYHQKNRDIILKKQKEWREEHAEKHRENARRYYWEHRDKCLAQKRIYQEANPGIREQYYNSHKEQLKEWRKEWKKKNPDKVKVYTHRKRSKRRALPATLTTKQWQIIKDYFNNKCCYCGQKLPLEQEHFIPVAQNGAFTHNNIIPACRSCNLSKKARSFFEWYPEQLFYNKKRERNILKFLGYTKQGDQQPMLLI